MTNGKRDIGEGAPNDGNGENWYRQYMNVGRLRRFKKKIDQRDIIRRRYARKTLRD